MPYLLDHLNFIGDLLKQPTFGLITDVDGTISETAPTPEQAKVTPLCRTYLSILIPHLTVVATISGRPAVEIKNMIGINGMVYIGNHGLERWIEGHSELSEEAKDYVIATWTFSPQQGKPHYMNLDNVRVRKFNLEWLYASDDSTVYKAPP